jgi:uncharacterized protein YbjT (DUF2867 family)
MYLVVGATGLVGGEVCRLLASKGHKVRALTRSVSDRARVDALKQLKVETVTGDLKDKASLIAALKGVDTVISTASASPLFKTGDTIQNVDLEGTKNLVDAAKAAGVNEFSFVSFRQSKYAFPLHEVKMAVEEYIRKSGIKFTVWQPSFFMEVWLGAPQILGFDGPNAKARIYGSGKAKVTWISFLDVAKFVVDGLHKDATRNATIQLGGPEALSYHDVIQVYEGLGVKKFTNEYLPEGALREQFETAGDPVTKSFSGLMAWIANGDVVEMTQTLEYLPVKMSTIGDFAKRQLGK